MAVKHKISFSLFWVWLARRVVTIAHVIITEFYILKSVWAWIEGWNLKSFIIHFILYAATFRISLWLNVYDCIIYIYIFLFDAEPVSLLFHHKKTRVRVVYKKKTICSSTSEHAKVSLNTSSVYWKEERKMFNIFLLYSRERLFFARVHSCIFLWCFMIYACIKWILSTVIIPL